MPTNITIFEDELQKSVFEAEDKPFKAHEKHTCKKLSALLHSRVDIIEGLIKIYKVCSEA